MGLQFLFTGITKKLFAGHAGKVVEGEHMSPKTEFAAAAVGGLLSSFFTTPVELIMIQQQKFGGSFGGTLKKVVSTYGVTKNGMMRGLTGAASRDAIYVAGMLGVTPILSEYITSHTDTPTGMATLYASLLGGVVAAVPSHPFDVIKTCMQVSRMSVQMFICFNLHTLTGSPKPFYLIPVTDHAVTCVSYFLARLSTRCVVLCKPVSPLS
jgi:hypothetical protein